jgi:uncharacterized membrane protein YjjB (DUF3815 family)
MHRQSSLDVNGSRKIWIVIFFTAAMAHFTGYLLGKVQLDSAIRSEVLASLVETLVQKYQSPDSSKKPWKFSDNHK